MRAAGKQPPRLEISIEIDGNGARVTISAASAEDEVALIRWLRRKPRVVASLGDVEALLAQLERQAA